MMCSRCGGLYQSTDPERGNVCVNCGHCPHLARLAAQVKHTYRLDELEAPAPLRNYPQRKKRVTRKPRDGARLTHVNRNWGYGKG